MWRLVQAGNLSLAGGDFGVKGFEPDGVDCSALSGFVLLLTVGCHGSMATWIRNPSRRKLGLAPRDHLKTSVWTIADTVGRIAINPNIRILIINETASNAQNFLTRIKAVFERNAIFRWVFG
jgi:hypothetical protein